MRQHVLLRSIMAQLGPGETVRNVVQMWRRHHLALPFIAGAFVVLFCVALLAGVEQLSSQFAIGLAGVAVAGMATTDQRILAQTDDGLVMLQSSRIRWHAKRVIERLPDTTPIEVLSDNLVISDWNVNGQRYSMMKRSQRAMSAITSR